MKAGRAVRITLIALFFLASLGGLVYLGLAPSTASSAGVCREVSIMVKTENGGDALFLSPDRILEELSQRGVSLKGKALDSINLRQIEQVLLRIPIYKRAEAFISPATSSVQIRLTEKLPLFLVYEPSGKSYYVTQGKDTFGVSPTFAAYLPVVSGDVTKAIATGPVYDLLSVVRSDPYFADYFGQVYVDRDEGISLIPRVGTTRLIFGHDGDWATMLRKWRVFAESVLPKRGMNAFAYVNLAFADQIIAGQRYPAEGEELEEPPLPAPPPPTPPAKSQEKQAVEKKPEAKKPAEKKPEPKKAPEKKSVEKKTEAKKPAEKKAPEKKPQDKKKPADKKATPSKDKPTHKPTAPSQKKKQ